MTVAGIIANMRARGISTTEVSDANLTILIADCLETYSYYKPKKIFTFTQHWITTTAYVAQYAFPTGALRVDMVFWQPDYNESLSLSELYTELIGEIYDIHHPSDILVTFNQVNAMRRNFEGSWRVVNTDETNNPKKIVLIPTPTISSVKVPIIYSTTKTISDLNIVDDKIFERLVYATTLKAKAQYYFSQGGWRAGAYAVSDKIGISLDSYANKEMDDTLLILSNGGYGTSDFPSTMVGNA